MAERDFVMRPLSLTEILDESFTIYRRNFGLLFGIALIPNVLAILVMTVLTAQQTSEIDVTVSEALATFAILMLGVLLALIGAEIANGAMTSAISERILGRSATLGSSYRKIGKRIVPFAGYLFLKYLLIFVGFMFCFIPGVVFTIMTFVSVCAFVIEGQGPRESLERSWKLVSGHGMRVFGIYLLIYIVAGLITYGISFLFSLAITGSLEGAVTESVSGEFTNKNPLVIVATGVVEGLASAIVAPVLATAVTVTYYDLRVRKEGFDLEMLAESLNRR